MTGRTLSLVFGFGVPLLLGGCAYMPQEAERAEFRDPPPMDRTLPKAKEQAAAPGSNWPQDEWWHLFGSPELDRAMELALRENPGLRKAYASLGEADALAQVEGARLLPWVDAENTFRQVRVAKNGIVAAYNPALGGREFTSDTLNPLSFRYEFDFWGKNRAAFNAALGEAAADEAEFAETRLLLTTAVARSFIRGAALAQQLALAHRMVELRRELLNLAETLFRTGLESKDKAYDAALALEAAKKREVGAQELLIFQQNLLARLMGGGPDDTQNFFVAKRVVIPAKIVLPAHLPVELLAHRPDLAAAMHRAEAAAEQIHVAKAQFLPSFDLVAATAGLEAVVPTSKVGTLASLLFRGSDLNYIVAPGIHLPIFEGGRLRGELAATRSRYDEAVELYNDTLLHAAQEVADSLTSWKETGSILEFHNRLVQHEYRELQLTQTRVGAGISDLRDAVASKNAVLEQQYETRALEAEHLSAMVDLIQALGGGYSNGVETPRPHLAPEEALSGLETITPAWTLDSLASPLLALFHPSRPD
jgi:NodT family efflux transporter outer membrane factor (OMF) lipoprotein